MKSLAALIESKKFRRHWNRVHLKIQEDVFQIGRQTGFQILEDILNHSDCELNRDCFLYRKGEQLRRLHMSRPRGKRFSAFDASTRNLIRREIVQLGASLKVDQVSRFSPLIHRISQELSQVLGVAVTSNLYFTPAFSKCFAPHVDPYHIFVLQLAGKKFWNLSEPKRSTAVSLGEAPVFQYQEILSTGDLMYLPENAIHEAATQEQPSVHVTFGFHPVPLNHYLASAFEQTQTSALGQLASGVLLSSQPLLFSHEGLNSKKIDELTREFKAHLLQLKKRGKGTLLPEQLDLEQPLRLPLDLDIFPDTAFQFRKQQKAPAIIARQPEKVQKVLKNFSRQKFFYAGDLIRFLHPELNWQKAHRLLRELLEGSAVQIALVEKARKPDPLQTYQNEFKRRDLHYYFGKDQSLCLFKTGASDGFLRMNPRQTRFFLSQVPKGSVVLDRLAEKIQNG